MQGVPYSPYKRNAFITAVREGKINRVREIIRSRGSCYAEEWKDGYSLLRVAVEKKHTHVAKLLLTNGSKVNSRHKNSCNTPLHFAVLNGDIEIVQMLLARGANINAKNVHGQTPLHNAVQSMETEFIGMLLNQGANLNAADENNITPLHLAAGNGNEEITKLLLTKDANVNARRNDDTTCLHIAAESGHLHIVEHLLKHGADVHSQSRKGHKPLYLAVENGHEKVIKLLLEHGADIDAEDKDRETMLYLAVKKGSSIFVENILKHRPDPNNRSNSGVLNVAVRSCGTEYDKIVKDLLQYGFTINPIYTKNIMYHAVKKGYLELVKDLLKRGTDVNMLCKSSGIHYIPLHIASFRNWVEVVKLLISYGANINAEHHNGMTALHFATKSGHKEVVEHLLKCGANVNATTKFGLNRALHLAIENFHIEIVELLLRFGSSIYSTDKYDRIVPGFLYRLQSCRHGNYCNLQLHASCEGHKRLVIALLEHGFDVTITSRNNYTALGSDMHDNTAFFGNNNVTNGFDLDGIIANANVVEILKCHMVKIKAANLYAVKGAVLSIPSREISSNNELRDFLDKCEKEVASMKCEKIVNTYISFYDILTKHVSQLAMYARNESIVEAFRSGDYKKKFPIYGSMIDINFRKGEKRKEFMKQGNKLLDALFNDFPEIPRGCTDRIVSYLNDDDLRNLMEAGKAYA